MQGYANVSALQYRFIHCKHLIISQLKYSQVRSCFSVVPCQTHTFHSHETKLTNRTLPKLTRLSTKVELAVPASTINLSSHHQSRSCLYHLARRGALKPETLQAKDLLSPYLLIVLCLDLALLSKRLFTFDTAFNATLSKICIHFFSKLNKYISHLIHNVFRQLNQQLNLILYNKISVYYSYTYKYLSAFKNCSVS